MAEKTTKPNSDEGVIIPPSYKLPLLLSLVGITSIPLPLTNWPSISLATFGFFLLLQSLTLKIKITSKALIVLQLGRELRQFPFENWLAWRLLFHKMPGLLYFREKASPHLLPILFNPDILKLELQKRVGNLEVGKKEDLASKTKN